MSLARATAFVIGAGASVDFGFPTGLTLRKGIIQGIRQGPDGSELSRLLVEIADFGHGDQTRFADRFEQSGSSSIDAFLASNPSFEEIGKAAIAIAICSKEEPSAFDDRDHWLQFLWNEMGGYSKSVDDFVGANTGTRFITFNYDRSIEYYFVRAAAARFGISEEEAVDALAEFMPLHVYGSVGALAVGRQQHGHDNKRKYQRDIKALGIDIARRSIKVVAESRAGPSEDFKAAGEMLERVDAIVFLGFGFDATNCERLGVTRILSVRNRDLYATTFGMLDGQVFTAANRIGRMPTQYAGNCRDGLRFFPLFK